MISVITNKNSASSNYIETQLRGAGYDVLLLTAPTETTFARALNFAQSSSDFVVIVGDTHLAKDVFSKTFKVPLFYDRRAESNVLAYCEAVNVKKPDQFLLDKLCVTPENFLTFQGIAIQSSCCGEYLTKKYYFIADSTDGLRIFDDYVINVLNATYKHSVIRHCKLFGLSSSTICNMFDRKIRLQNVSRACETDETLDSLLTIIFDKGTSPSLIERVMNEVYNIFNEYIYSKINASLQQSLVLRLTEMHRTLAVAESITGGLISKMITDIPGASMVLKEGIVSYSISSKVERLNVNPHTIDSSGVVSKQVAEQMANGLLKTQQVDYCISTTGYAGPFAQDGKPVGFACIAFGNKAKVEAFRYQFAGTRDQIRKCVANTAIFLLLKKIQTI